MTPFSLWERELPKLIGDSRYQEIPNMKDRRAGFEEFCKKHAGSRKRQKLNAESVHANGDSKDSAASKAKLLDLLKDSNLNQNMQMSDLEKKFKTDERWKVKFWLIARVSLCFKMNFNRNIVTSSTKMIVIQRSPSQILHSSLLKSCHCSKMLKT